MATNEIRESDRNVFKRKVLINVVLWVSFFFLWILALATLRPGFAERISSIFLDPIAIVTQAIAAIFLPAIGWIMALLVPVLFKIRDSWFKKISISAENIKVVNDGIYSELSSVYMNIGSFFLIFFFIKTTSCEMFTPIGGLVTLPVWMSAAIGSSLSYGVSYLFSKKSYSLVLNVDGQQSDQANA